MKNNNGFKMDMTEFRGNVVAQLSDIKIDIAKIDGKLQTSIDITNNRLTSLELWKTQIVSQFVVIFAVINLVIAISFDWIKKQVFGNKI